MTIKNKDEIIAELKAENEQLKKENINLLKEIAEFTMANRMLKEVTKYQRQTLQEIKTIAENYIKGCVDCSLIAEPYECDDCTDGGMAKLGKKILDLINQAEEE